jgi:transcriptional regulator with XRE-family HTH domain
LNTQARLQLKVSRAKKRLWETIVDQELLYKIVGEQIRKARLDAGLSQAELAKTSGHLRTSITTIEGGRQKPPLHVLYDLCGHLDIEPVSILPLRREVLDQSVVPVNTGQNIERVPPEAAEVLKQMLKIGKRSHKRAKA